MSDTTTALDAGIPIRCLATDIALQPLPPGPEGTAVAAAGAVVLSEEPVSVAEVGIWEMSAGATHDVEADEIFVVVAGRARIDFDDGASVDLSVGDVLRLQAGARTTWTVHEDFRKVYFVLDKTVT